MSMKISELGKRYLGQIIDAAPPFISSALKKDNFLLLKCISFAGVGTAALLIGRAVFKHFSPINFGKLFHLSTNKTDPKLVDLSLKPTHDLTKSKPIPLLPDKVDSTQLVLFPFEDREK